MIEIAPPARRQPETPEKLRFRIGGMDCGACGAKIENALRRVPGVGEVNVAVGAGVLTLVRAGQPEDAAADAAMAAAMAAAMNAAVNAAVERQVRSLGFTIEKLAPPVHAARGPAGEPAAVSAGETEETAAAAAPKAAWWRSPKARLTLGYAFLLAAAWLLGLLFPPAATAFFALATLFGVAAIGRKAFAALITGTPFSIEMLMTVAALGAVAIGATEEAATVILLFLIGELLEGVAAERARSGIRQLADLVPARALVEENGAAREVASASVAIGALVLARPGERIAADGVVEAGSSAVDEAPVTGESVPKSKNPGDSVFAGTINCEALLRIRVNATAQDNTLARVIRLVEEAQESRAPTERFIQRFARTYTPAVLALGVSAAVLPPLLAGASWSEWIYKGLAILLISCPCALVISTPAAIAAALAAGARRGLLMKGGAVLERLGAVTVAAFDKTGTLTAGKPEVTEVVGLGRSEVEVLALAAALESGSTHPLAKAVLARAEEDGLVVPPAEELAALPGRGIGGRVGPWQLVLASPAAADALAPLGAVAEAKIAARLAEGKTVSVLLVDGKPAGFLALRDEARPDAAAGLAALRAAGVETLMLTGDHEQVARAIGAGLGIEVRAGLLPEDKQRLVRELQRQGEVVAKIGDGINDAPALAAADVGIAMGGGADVALETAGAAILHGRVADVASLIRLSRDTRRVILQNIAAALGLKAFFLATTLLGYTGIWPAILADTGATVLVTLNAMRLLAWRPPRLAG